MRADKSRDTITDLAEEADEDEASRTVPTPSGLSHRYVLERRGSRVSLRPGSILVGRGGSCQLVIDDSLVSRRHALLVVKADGVRIKDLGSANGVYVNGARIHESVQLKSGDRVLIGQEEMVLQSNAHAPSEPISRSGRVLAETLHGEVEGFGHAMRPPAPAEEAEATQQGQALDLLGGVANKVLALGRGEEAERIMATCLQSVLTKAKEAGTVDPELAEKAVTFATKLAAATGKGRWVDYGFELYVLIKRPLPGAIVEQLYDILRNVDGLSLQLLNEYVAALRSAQGRFGPTERFLAHRIENLERLVK